MTAPSSDTIATTQMRCPVCRATQPWSDTCRRCKSDLTLLRSVADAYRAGRRRYLQALHAGRFGEALQEAEQLHALDPGEESSRFLAVAAFLCQDWPAALRAAQQVREGA